MTEAGRISTVPILPIFRRRIGIIAPQLRSLDMPLTRKAFALSLGLLGTLSAATIAQPQRSGQSDGQTLTVEDATVDWFQKSDVSALREGVIDRMELRIGKEVGSPVNGQGAIIGYLHKEVADLEVAQARIQAESNGAILKAEAQRELSVRVLKRNESLLKKGPNFISQEEIQKAEAEYLVANAAVLEARDTQKLAVAKLASAQRAADEHVIRAPFAGWVIEEYKHEGESVRANEPVVKVGNLDKVRVWAYIPIEYAYSVIVGTEIAIQPRLSNGARTGKHPIEQKKFRGVVTFVDPALQAIGESGVRVFAEIDNQGHELRPGLRATMTFFLKPEGTTPLPATAPASVGARSPELPPLPR